MNLLDKAAVLRKARNEAAGYGDVSGVQFLNAEIAKIARRLKVDYYSIA